MINPQPWQAPYKVVEIPQHKVRLAFPENYFSATITGSNVQLSVSTDLAGLPSVIERLNVLLKLMELGPLPVARGLCRGREAVEGDFVMVEPICDPAAAGPEPAGPGPLASTRDVH